MPKKLESNYKNYLYLGFETRKTVIEFVAYAFPRMAAPRDTTLHIVISDKSAVFTYCLHICGKKLDFASAVGTYLYFQRRRSLDIARAGTPFNHQAVTLSLY